jgi:hypothetical protein
MSRFPQKLCPKGSQRWIQWFVNHAAHVLDAAISLGPIDWRSPLREDEYAEYRDEAFLARLGIALPRRSLESFWPRGGPQWDALGRADSHRLPKPQRRWACVRVSTADVAGPSRQDEWEQAITVVHEALGLASVQAFVRDIFINVAVTADAA